MRMDTAFKFSIFADHINNSLLREDCNIEHQKEGEEVKIISRTMNLRGGDAVGAPKKVFRPRPKNSKDRDEDLLLFREMLKREKDQVFSLLQPVSAEFEANGNYALYGMAPGKKGPAFDILAEGGKNDYDWLKTPPATPLFPSLEVETNAPELAVQREIPILRPLTRFAGKPGAGKEGIQRSKSPEFGKPKALPRYSTPSGRPSISVAEKKNIKSAPVVNQKINQNCSDLNLENSKRPSLNAKSLDNKESQLNFMASNLSKSMGMDSNIKATKPKSRGVSPSVRSRIPAQIPGLAEETPPNLKTHDRSVSASRGRTTKSNPPVSQKQEPITKTTRQSCSPSVTRGRKQENDTASQRDKTQLGNNRTQVLGSRMVDRFLNARMSGPEERYSNKTKLNASMNESGDARKTSIEERQNKTKFNTSINEGSGFGRLMSKSSLEMALKHMEFQKDSAISRKNGTSISRRSSSVNKRNPIS